MALLNYTTSISAQKTVGEIMGMLVAHGATAVLMNYDEDRQIESLSFRVTTAKGDIEIRLPVNPDAVLRVMKGTRTPRHYCNREQALRVAWRIAKSWVQAQMAIIETEMVKIDQVFLPYWVTPSGETVYENYVGTKFQLGKGG